MFEASWFRLAAVSAPVMGMIVAIVRGAWIAVGFLAALELLAIALAARESRKQVEAAAIPGTVQGIRKKERRVVAVGNDATIGVVVDEALADVGAYRPASVCIVVPPAGALTDGPTADGRALPEATGALAAAMSRIEHAGAKPFLRTGAIDTVTAVRSLVETAGADEIILGTPGPLEGPGRSVYDGLVGLGVPVRHVIAHA